MSINTISTECTPQQEINFDEIFPIETNEKEISKFSVLDEKPNPDFIKICKNSLKLSKINENILIDDNNNSNLKRTMSYSDLKINMKKEEEFNLEESLNIKNIGNERIYSYLMEEMKEKVFIEEDYKIEEEELYYDDEEEEEEDEEMINAIFMYNSRNISSDYKKIIRERLKRRIKEDEKKYKKEEKMFKENEKKREMKVKQKEKELLLKPQKKGDNGSLYKLLNSDLLDENLFIRYLSVDNTSIIDFLINILYDKKNIRKFIPNILHEIISIYAFKKNGLESISKFLIDFSIKNVSFGIKTVLTILSLINISSSNKIKLNNLKNEIESNIALLTNNYNLKQMAKKNLSIYSIKNIDELELFDEIDMEGEGKKNTPDYVFFSKYYEMTMDFYNEIYLLPKKIEEFIQKNILNSNMNKNSYKVSKMDNHSLIQTEFINLVNEINNKIGNLSQYRERIKEEIIDEKKKLKLKSLFTGYILPLNIKNKNTKINFDIDNIGNNYILINIITDYCELKFTEADKYLKKFDIKLAFEIIQVKEAKSWDEIINDKNKKVKNKIITVSERKKRELDYDPFSYIFNGNPNIEYIKNSSQYNSFNTHNIIFYKLIFDKELTGDIIINQFKNYFNNLILNSNNGENNNSINEIKIPDIIPINENCFLVECLEYNNNLISLKQIENDLKIYKIKNDDNDNKENNNININTTQTKQINSKYKLFEELENQNPNNIFFAKFIYDSFGTNLIENDALQKNLIESFINNILIEYLFNNKEINYNIENSDIFNYLYIDKDGFLTLINNHNHYLSTDNSLINNKFKLNNELFQLLTDNDVGSDSFQYFVNLIIYYICEIKKYYDTFENYVNVFLNNNGIRPLNWSNKFKDWIIYSLQERFFWNKTDVEITNKLKKDISEINMKKNNSISKFKFFIDSVKAKIHRKKFD